MLSGETSTRTATVRDTPGRVERRGDMENVAIDRASIYLDEMVSVVQSISRADVRVVVERLFEGWRERRTTYIIGNGGSASTASHMMNDLNKLTTLGSAPRFRAIALTDNVPILTAVANDIDYADVFVEQLRNLLLPTDILVAISGSGNSENVIRAAQYARETGAFVIGLCGLPGSRLCAVADAFVAVPAESICHQEDVHLMLNHAIALELRERIAATL